MLPRMRAWMFSSACPRAGPRRPPASISRYASWAGSIGMICRSMPRFSARAPASALRALGRVARGHETPVTCSGPSASTATRGARATSRCRRRARARRSRSRSCGRSRECRGPGPRRPRPPRSRSGVDRHRRRRPICGRARRRAGELRARARSAAGVSSVLLAADAGRAGAASRTSRGRGRRRAGPPRTAARGRRARPRRRRPAVPVEDELVLPADQVEKPRSSRCPRRARSSMRSRKAPLPAVEGRAVDVDHHSAPPRACACAGPSGYQMSSQMLTPTSAPSARKTGAPEPSLEVAVLVEDAVVRQELLVVAVQDLAARDDGGGVVDVRVEVDETRRP